MTIELVMVLRYVSMEKKQLCIQPPGAENKPSTSVSGATMETRVMIFAQYRDSVQEIAEMLNCHQPLVKCMNFVGQSSAGKATKGISQKEQLRVSKATRETNSTIHKVKASASIKENKEKRTIEIQSN